uniref:NADH:ubiquinone reductase (H(+)-translocating) n=1 Tax=Echinochasmus japonicus TaxID=1197313 RepID=A0A186QDQ6_9TREM|nr:NADH dehydrogenase subunit 5 [Echinochasmus japonicus]AKL39067.1 NADH dehydrogenase subunit 5 [Echinochasmus japonicus]
MLLVSYFFLGLVVLWLQVFLGWFGVFNLVGYGLGDFCFLFCVDEVSVCCIYMLFCCGSIALLYCYHYFGEDSSEGYKLFPLIVWFLGVMGILVFSGSLIFSLVFWEYLGLVSFLLILFYSNSSSLRASLITLFASRFGDVSLFMLVLWLCWWGDISSSLFGVLFLLVVLTKSACYPFVSWLLEAMRAPTPVSSLVHSSTLVAAGVWFLFRYDSLLSGGSCWVMVWICLVTVVLTALSAIFFMDLKKIVALSTCNNVAWCVLFFVSGDVYLALLQLVTHGVCKCYLFMSVGDLMCQSGGSQSSVGVFLSSYSGLYLPFVQCLLVLCLCGIPFIGVFFSKHCLFSGILYGCSGGLLFVYLFALFLSYVYSVRFSLLLLCVGGGLGFGFSSFFVVICPLVVLGSFLNGVWSVALLELTSLSMFWSSLILFIQVFGVVCGGAVYWYSMGKGCWSSLLWGCEGYVLYMYHVFSFVTFVCLVSFYRWEVYLCGVWSMLGPLFAYNRGSFFSLNFFVAGLLFFFFFFLVLF